MIEDLCIRNTNFMLQKHVKVTVTSVAVATTRFLLGICDCTVVGVLSTGDVWPVLSFFHCGHSHVSPGMD